MSKQFSISSLLCTICICILFSHIGISHCDTVVNQTSLLYPSKLRVHNGQLYIGARNKIYRLNSDLSENFTINTCTEGCKENYNKVLLVRGENDATGELFACGTGNEGRCAMWSLNNTSSPSVSSGDVLMVSTKIGRPDEAVWVDNSIILATTFGPTAGNYTIASIDKKLEYEDFIKLESTISKSEFLVYFKASLQFEQFSFILTNQKAFKNDHNIVSKMIRMCESLYSYHDIILQCTVDGSHFNLVQDAVFMTTDNGTVLTVAFAQGSNPESPEQSSAICSISLDNLEKKFKEGALEFLACNTSNKMIYISRLSDQCPIVSKRNHVTSILFCKLFLISVL